MIEKVFFSINSFYSKILGADKYKEQTNEVWK